MNSNQNITNKNYKSRNIHPESGLSPNPVKSASCSSSSSNIPPNESANSLLQLDMCGNEGKSCLDPLLAQFQPIQQPSNNVDHPSKSTSNWSSSYNLNNSKNISAIMPTQMPALPAIPGFTGPTVNANNFPHPSSNQNLCNGAPSEDVTPNKSSKGGVSSNSSNSTTYANTTASEDHVHPLHHTSKAPYIVNNNLLPQQTHQNKSSTSSTSSATIQPQQQQYISHSYNNNNNNSINTNNNSTCNTDPNSSPNTLITQNINHHHYPYMNQPLPQMNTSYYGPAPNSQDWNCYNTYYPSHPYQGDSLTALIYPSSGASSTVLGGYSSPVGMHPPLHGGYLQGPASDGATGTTTLMGEDSLGGSSTTGMMGQYMGWPTGTPNSNNHFYNSVNPNPTSKPQTHHPSSNSISNQQSTNQQTPFYRYNQSGYTTNQNPRSFQGHLYHRPIKMDCTHATASVIAVTLTIIAFFSPIAMVTLPLTNIVQWKNIVCDIDCESQLISLTCKLILVGTATYLTFLRNHIWWCTKNKSTSQIPSSLSNHNSNNNNTINNTTINKNSPTGVSCIHTKNHNYFCSCRNSNKLTKSLSSTQSHRFSTNLPRLTFLRSFLLFLTFIITVVFWLFYGIRLIDPPLYKSYVDSTTTSSTNLFWPPYQSAVSLAMRMTDSLLLVHYLGIVLIVLKERTDETLSIKVIRSPDGAMRVYHFKKMSIQLAAIKILKNYVVDFQVYNPFIEAPARRRTYPTQQPYQSQHYSKSQYAHNRRSHSNHTSSRTSSTASHGDNNDTATKLMLMRDGGMGNGPVDSTVSSLPPYNPSPGTLGLGSLARYKIYDVDGPAPPIDSSTVAMVTVASPQKSALVGSPGSGSIGKCPAQSRRKTSSLKSFDNRSRRSCPTLKNNSANHSRYTTKYSNNNNNSNMHQKSALSNNYVDSTYSAAYSSMTQNTPPVHQRHHRHQNTRNDRHHHNQRAVMHSNNDRYYEELEFEKRVSKRRVRLMLASEEAFKNLFKYDENYKNSTAATNPSGQVKPLDAYEAAQAMFSSTLLRPLQKFLRATRQQPRFSMEWVIGHLRNCVTYELGSRTFLEPFLSGGPVLEDPGFQQQLSLDPQVVAGWTLLSDRIVSRSIEEGVVFQLRQGEVSLFCTVRSLPEFCLTEAELTSGQNHGSAGMHNDRFIFKLDSETSV